MKRLCSCVLAAAVGLGGCLLLAPTTVLAKKGDKHFKQGLQYEAVQDWEKAAQVFTLAVAADPTNLEYQLHFRRASFGASKIYMQHGRVLAERRDYVGAYNAFRQARAFDPVNEQAASEMQRMVSLQSVREETQGSTVGDEAETRERQDSETQPVPAQDAKLALPQTEQLRVISYSEGLPNGATAKEGGDLPADGGTQNGGDPLNGPRAKEGADLPADGEAQNGGDPPNGARAKEGGITVSGVAADQTGAVIPGEKLTLINNATGETRKTMSDDSGRFSFNNVAPGEYKLKGEAEGFQTSELALTVGAQPLNVKVKMEIVISGDVTVSGKFSQPELAENNADAVNFNTNMIGYLPAFNNNLLPVLNNFLTPAAMEGNGPSIVVDGVEGGDLNLPTEAIRSVAINKNPYSAEYRRPGSARIEVTTKPGTRKYYDGTTAFTLRNSSLTARNAFATEKPDLDTRLFSVYLGGPAPLNKDATIFVGGNRLMDDKSAVVNALTLAGPVFENVPTFKRNTNLVGRLDIKVDRSHRVNLNYNFFDQPERNRGVGGLKLAEQGIDANTRGHRFQFADSKPFSTQLINNLRFSFVRRDQRLGALAHEPAIQVKGAFTGGPSQTAWSEQQTRMDFQDVAVYSAGKHTLRFGGAAMPRFYKYQDASDFGGTFVFSDLQEFAAGRPIQFRIVQGDPHITFSQHEVYAFIQDEMALAKNLNLLLGLRYEWQAELRDHSNFAPRLAMAFAPGERKTVFRAGAGIFYDRLPEAAIQRSLLIDGVHTREVVIDRPSFPDPFQQGSTRGTPPSVWRLAPDLAAPYLFQSSVSVERKLNNATQLTLEYQTLRGVHLFRARDVNAPIGGSGPRPDPNFLLINQVESSASLRGNALLVTVQGEFFNDFKGMVQYSLSRTTDNTNGPFELPANSYDLTSELGRSNFDKRHRLNFAGTFSVPWDMKLAWVMSVASSSPFDITTGSDDNGDSVVNDRPPLVTRNTGRGPGYAQLDLRLSKLIRVPNAFPKAPGKQSRNLSVNIDLFNILNRNNLSNVTGNLSSPLFGRATSSLQPRTIQLSCKYVF